MQYHIWGVAVRELQTSCRRSERSKKRSRVPKTETETAAAARLLYPSGSPRGQVSQQGGPISRDGGGDSTPCQQMHGSCSG